MATEKQKSKDSQEREDNERQAVEEPVQPERRHEVEVE